jgi:SAM-dependent methyltransferase
MQNLELIRSIRLAELDVALRFIPPGARVLELGAGAGWQALALADSGFEVVALETTANHYPGQTVFPLMEYDGYSIPSEASCFDVVFSSNVLEHVPDLQRLLRDTHRVLRDEGIAIHILPTPNWRIWGNLAHPVWILERGLRRLMRGASTTTAGGVDPSAPGIKRNWRVDLASHIMPSRHGERGNVWTEAYYFSKAFWEREFQKGGFELVQSRSAGIFYISGGILGKLFPMPARRLAATLLGPGCTVFVLKKAGQS